MFLNLANVNFFAGSPAPLADFSGGISPTPSSCLRAGGAAVKDSSSSVGDRPHGNIHLSARYLLDLMGTFLLKIHFFVVVPKFERDEPLAPRPTSLNYPMCFHLQQCGCERLVRG